MPSPLWPATVRAVGVPVGVNRQLNALRADCPARAIRSLGLPLPNCSRSASPPTTARTYIGAVSKSPEAMLTVASVTVSPSTLRGVLCAFQPFG